VKKAAGGLDGSASSPQVHRQVVRRSTLGGDDLEDVMSLRSLAGYSIAALAGAAMFALSSSSASAFTLSGPSLQQPIASAQIEKVWCRWGRCGYGYGWRGGYGYRWGGAYRWGPGYGYGYRNCWINRWGNRVCNW
jgi:hypothetical protein